MSAFDGLLQWLVVVFLAVLYIILWCKVWFCVAFGVKIVMSMLVKTFQVGEEVDEGDLLVKPSQFGIFKHVSKVLIQETSGIPYTSSHDSQILTKFSNTVTQLLPLHLIGPQKIGIDDTADLWSDLIVQHTLHLFRDSSQLGKVQDLPGIIQDLPIHRAEQGGPLSLPGALPRTVRLTPQTLHGAEKTVDPREVGILHERNLRLLQAPACQLAVVRKGDGIKLCIATTKHLNSTLDAYPTPETQSLKSSLGPEMSQSSSSEQSMLLLSRSTKDRTQTDWPNIQLDEFKP